MRGENLSYPVHFGREICMAVENTEHQWPYKAIFCGDIPLHRPEKEALYMVGTSNQSVPEMAVEILKIRSST